MAPQTLEKRVDVLEQRVRALDGLPSQVAQLTLKISQLHQEMQNGFSALRDADGKLQRDINAVRKRMNGLHKEAMTAIRTSKEEVLKEVLTHMRVMHEDLRLQIALLREGAGGAGTSPGNPDGPKG